MVELETVGYYRWPMKYSSMKNLNGKKNMFGSLRVIVLLIGFFIIPTTFIMLPLYLKYRIFTDMYFAVTESDVLEITDGISSIFCEAHSLSMNSSFNAFQVENSNINTDRKKHFRLRKSMSVPDDSLEYWGFFLNRGSIVNLTLCSRFKGGRIMVVKDMKNFSTCGLSGQKPKSTLEQHYRQGEVHILFDSNAEVISPKSEEYESEDLSKESLKAYRILKERYEHHKYRAVNITRVKRSMNEKTLNHKEAIHGKTNDSDSDESSFERTLVTCFEGQVLLNDDFFTSSQCTSIEYLVKNTHMRIEHEIQTNDYYFYIFYSDNDAVVNEIHVVFDIFKPTFEYSNYSNGCLNTTQCTFDIPFLSKGKVIVEIPLRDGIEHEVDDITILMSTCQPRKLIYAMFPVTVLILILLFAFV